MSKISKIFTALFATLIVFSFLGNASAANLTQEQKELYYKEYVSIVEETNSKYGSDLKLTAFEDWKSTEWVTPEDFKEIATDMANAEWVVEPDTGIKPLATTVASKSASVKLKNTDVTVTVSASFNTILVSDRQVFSPNLNYVRSSSNPGTWSQISYNPILQDGNRTMILDVSGAWSYNGLNDTTNIRVTFYCSSTGSVS